MIKSVEKKQMLSEKDAILACQAGNSEAYRVLVEKYKSRAYYSALLFTKNRDDALDLSQDAFFRAFRAIKSFDTSKNFYTWFYKILKNLCINHVQRFKKMQRFYPAKADDDRPVEYKSDSANPEEIFEQNERSQALWQAIDSLKDSDREIIILKEFDEMSYQEIAEVLNIPIGSVMSRLYYARKKLLKLLEPANAKI